MHGMDVCPRFPGVSIAAALVQGFNVKSHGTGSQVKIPGRGALLSPLDLLISASLSTTMWCYVRKEIV